MCYLPIRKLCGTLYISQVGLCCLDSCRILQYVPHVLDQVNAAFDTAYIAFQVGTEKKKELVAQAPCKCSTGVVVQGNLTICCVVLTFTRLLEMESDPTMHQNFKKNRNTIHVLFG